MNNDNLRILSRAELFRAFERLQAQLAVPDASTPVRQLISITSELAVRLDQAGRTIEEMAEEWDAQEEEKLSEARVQSALRMLHEGRY